MRTWLRLRTTANAAVVVRKAQAKEEGKVAEPRVSRTRLAGPAEIVPETEGVDSWVDVAEEERNPRRMSVQGLLLKMLASVTKHKWAHPFKRPVTDKEAPDYKDIITNPMDFSTLRKRIEAGLVPDVGALVAGLNLIFSNAMLYNAKGSDYHKMALTLRDVVKQQHGLYRTWHATKTSTLPAGSPALAALPAPDCDSDFVAPLLVEASDLKSGQEGDNEATGFEAREDEAGDASGPAGSSTRGGRNKRGGAAASAQPQARRRMARP